MLFIFSTLSRIHLPTKILKLTMKLDGKYDDMYDSGARNMLESTSNLHEASAVLPCTLMLLGDEQFSTEVWKESSQNMQRKRFASVVVSGWSVSRDTCTSTGDSSASKTSCRPCHDITDLKWDKQELKLALEISRVEDWIFTPSFSVRSSSTSNCMTEVAQVNLFLGEEFGLQPNHSLVLKRRDIGKPEKCRDIREFNFKV